MIFITCDQAASAASGQCGEPLVFWWMQTEISNIPGLEVFTQKVLQKMNWLHKSKKRLVEPIQLLTDPIVIIRFQNFKVTVLG